MGPAECEDVCLGKDWGAGVRPCVWHHRQSISAGQDLPPAGAGDSLQSGPPQARQWLCLHGEGLRLLPAAKGQGAPGGSGVLRAMGWHRPRCLCASAVGEREVGIPDTAAQND